MAVATRVVPVRYGQTKWNVHGREIETIGCIEQKEIKL